MKNLDRLSKKKLGELLIDEGLCTRDQIETALGIQRQSESHTPLGEILLDMIDGLTESDIARAIAQQFQFPCLFAANYRVLPDAIEMISRPLMYDSQFIPVDIIGNTLMIVMGGLVTADLVTQIETETGKEVFIFVSTRSDVMSALTTHAPYDPAGEVTAEGGEDEFDWEAMFDVADAEFSSELMDE